VASRARVVTAHGQTLCALKRLEAIVRRILEVEYVANLGWAKPLLTAAGQKPQLRLLLKRWRGHRLSDLAFAIDTRLACLPQLTKSMDEDMRRVIDNLGEVSHPLGR
jgi:hypothetical protein